MVACFFMKLDGRRVADLFYPEPSALTFLINKGVLFPLQSVSSGAFRFFYVFVYISIGGSIYLFFFRVSGLPLLIAKLFLFIIKSYCLCFGENVISGSLLNS